MPWLKSGINRLIPSVIHQPCPQVPRTLAMLKDESVFADVGAGGRKISSRVICIDARCMANTDIVGDVHFLPVRNAGLDCLFCTGVLEHIADPAAALDEFMRVLKPEGILHLEVPFVQPFHQDPRDYWRWTLDGIRLFARQHGFTEVRSGALIGPASAMNAIIIAYFQGWFRSRFIRKIIDILLSFLLFPFKFLDYLLLKADADVLSAVYYVGKKRTRI